MKVYSCPDSTLEHMSKAFESICHDDLQASIKEYGSGIVLGRADAKEIVFKDFAQKTKLALEKVTVLTSLTLTSFLVSKARGVIEFSL